MALVVKTQWLHKSIESHLTTIIVTQRVAFELSVGLGCEKCTLVAEIKENLNLESKGNSRLHHLRLDECLMFDLPNICLPLWSISILKEIGWVNIY